MDSSTETLGIQVLFESIRDALNEGNAIRYSGYFTQDCHYVTYNGEHLFGCKRVGEFHERLFDTFLKGSRLVGEIESIRFLTDEIAIVHQTGSVIHRFQQKPSKKSLSINTNVVVKSLGEWKVLAFHNCRIKPMPPVIQFLNTLFKKIKKNQNYVI